MKKEINQLELIPEIKRLCNCGKYDEAFILARQIEDAVIAVKAQLLCIEHEESRRRRDNLRAVERFDSCRLDDYL